jgi:hypothetical protein
MHETRCEAALSDNEELIMANPLREPSDYLTLDSASSALEGVAGSLLGDTDETEDQDESEPEEIEAEAAAEADESEADESETVDTDNDESEPADDVSLETVEDVAKALGVDTNDLLNNLKLKIKVNGEERLVTLAEAQTGTQLEVDYRRKTSALAEERRAIQAEREQQSLYMQQVAHEAAAAVSVAEQLLMAEVNSPAMNELRQSNPAEWVARQTEAQAKAAQLAQARNQAQQQFAHAQQLQAQQQAQHLQSYLAEQQQQLVSKVPDWGDQKKTEVASFLQSEFGFTPDEIGKVFDHRLILLAMKAQRGATAEKDSTKVMTKVKTLPKLQAPGKASTGLTVKAKHIAGLKGQLKKTGHVRDAAKVIESLL